VSSVTRVTDIVGEIAAASEEQSTGVEQVNTAMTQMDQVTQSNAAQTEELSSTAQSLSDQATRLMELVGTFTLDRRATQPSAVKRSVQIRIPIRPAKGKPAAQSTGRSTIHPRNPAGLARPAAAAVAAGSSEDASFEEF
jgi:methyl-accepting chemotaxis protein